MLQRLCKRYNFCLKILGISTIQTHPKENDSLNWSNDAGMYNIDAWTLSRNSWPQFILPKSSSGPQSIFQEPSARTLLEDDVSLIALSLSIQLAFHLAQLVL